MIEPTAPLWQMHAFQFGSFIAFGLLFVIVRQVYRDDSLKARQLYAILVGCLLSFIWEWYMDVGPLQLGYDPRFVDLWNIRGVSLPLFMPFAYAWYFALPVLIFVPMSEWLQHRFGWLQYPFVFIVGGAYNVLVEYPATTFTSLWDYYWRSESLWTLGGMPATNIPAAGTTHLLMFVFCRYLWSRRQAVASFDASPIGAVEGAAQSMATEKGISFGVLALLYAAAVALAFQFSWTIWTPLLGLGMDSWFTGQPGGWITGR